uniref:Uncharacterized protein n=1 Tax=Hanusia phi TaxID=3032 RepID=A0A7S0HTU1_9CRYP
MGNSSHSSCADKRSTSEGDGAEEAPVELALLPVKEEFLSISSKYPYIPGVSNEDEYVEYVNRKVGVPVKQTAFVRIISFMRFLQDMHRSEVVQFFTSEDESQVSIFGFTVMTAKQPEFNHEVKEFVGSNPYWVRLNGREAIKRPTQQVYELLRQLGIVPARRTRGPQETDEDKKDFLYSTRYQFSRAKLLRARDRLRPNGILYLQSYRLLSCGPEDMNALHADIERVATIQPQKLHDHQRHSEAHGLQQAPEGCPQQTSPWLALMGLPSTRQQNYLAAWLQSDTSCTSSSRSLPLADDGLS